VIDYIRKISADTCLKMGNVSGGKRMGRECSWYKFPPDREFISTT